MVWRHLQGGQGGGVQTNQRAGRSRRISTETLVICLKFLVSVYLVTVKLNKNLIMKSLLALAAACVLLFFAPIACGAQTSLNVTGAWQTGTPDNQSIMICSEKFYSVAMYDLTNK